MEPIRSSGKRVLMRFAPFMPIGFIALFYFIDCATASEKYRTDGHKQVSADGMVKFADSHMVLSINDCEISDPQHEFCILSPDESQLWCMCILLDKSFTTRCEISKRNLGGQTCGSCNVDNKKACEWPKYVLRHGGVVITDDKALNDSYCHNKYGVAGEYSVCSSYDDKVIKINKEYIERECGVRLNSCQIARTSDWPYASVHKGLDSDGKDACMLSPNTCIYNLRCFVETGEMQNDVAACDGAFCSQATPCDSQCHCTATGFCRDNAPGACEGDQCNAQGQCGSNCHCTATGFCRSNALGACEGDQCNAQSQCGPSCTCDSLGFCNGNVLAFMEKAVT